MFVPTRPSRALGVFLATMLLVPLTGCGNSLPPLDGDPKPADQVALARAAVTRKSFRKALALLEGYLDHNPAGSDAGEAHYLLGISYYRTKQWPSAATEFSIVVNQFSGDLRVPDARFHLGLSYWKQSRSSHYDQQYTRQAIVEFDRFLTLYPEHPRAEDVVEARSDARNRLARKDYENGRQYLKLGYYKPARYYFRLVMKDYPDSTWTAYAKLGEAQSWAKEEEWSRAMDILEVILAASPPQKVEEEARDLMKEVESALQKDTGSG